MKKLIKSLVLRQPYFRALVEQNRAQGAYPAGHYYSPIPAQEDIFRNRTSSETGEVGLPGIDLNSDSQYVLLQEFRQFFDEMPFPEKQNPDLRYHFDQDWFGCTDAIFLYCFLRKFRPRKIIEIGSGYSSAAILDTLERSSFPPTDVTFIEPYPERLKSILKDRDLENVRIMESKVQDISLDVLTSIGSGDLLFIDSSHVVKCGSDLQYLLFDVIPRLPSGAFVHFHDVFFPFEYPSDWLSDGRFWNEIYFLRAFLAFNEEWRILFFNSYITEKFGEFVRRNFPICSRDAGGSLYLRRR